MEVVEPHLPQRGACEGVERGARCTLWEDCGREADVTLEHSGEALALPRRRLPHVHRARHVGRANVVLSTRVHQQHLAPGWG